MTKIIGHRGARGLAAENTLASFQKALEVGVDEIELDVRVTKDGVPVLNHDPYLHDASGGKLRHIRIRERTLADLRHYRPDLATLDEVVVLVDRRVPIIIEVKPKVSSAETIAAIQLYLAKGWQPTDFLLASFSQRILVELHAALPKIEIIINERFSGFRATLRARQFGARRLTFNHHNIWWFFIRGMARKGYHLSAFSLNNIHKAERWAKYGLYGIVTDFPDRFIHQIETATKITSTTPKQSPRPGTAHLQKRPARNKQRPRRRSK